VLGRLTVGLVVGLLVTSSTPPAHSTGADAGDLAPDLKALKASDLSVEFLGGDVRRLRFTTEVANMQTGPLELQPVADDCNANGDFADDRTAMQRIYHDDDANGYFTRGTDLAWRFERAGCFYYHDIHDHWHFEDFASYRLHEFDEDGGLGPPIRASEKISFCVWDLFRAKRKARGAPRARYYRPNCGANSIRGISIGWADRYPAPLDGQHIDVTGVADGEYCLVILTDPIDRLEESNELNNASGIRIALTADAVEWLPYRAC
jgi:hypothetical protein